MSLFHSSLNGFQVPTDCKNMADHKHQPYISFSILFHSYDITHQRIQPTCTITPYKPFQNRVYRDVTETLKCDA